MRIFISLFFVLGVLAAQARDEGEGLRRLVNRAKTYGNCIEMSPCPVSGELFDTAWEYNGNIVRSRRTCGRRCSPLTSPTLCEITGESGRFRQSPNEMSSIVVTGSSVSADRLNLITEGPCSSTMKLTGSIQGDGIVSLGAGGAAMYSVGGKLAMSSQTEIKIVKTYTHPEDTVPLYFVSISPSNTDQINIPGVANLTEGQQLHISPIPGCYPSAANVEYEVIAAGNMLNGAAEIEITYGNVPS
jgi:hypothetical protein